MFWIGLLAGMSLGACIGAFIVWMNSGDRDPADDRIADGDEPSGAVGG